MKSSMTLSKILIICFLIIFTNTISVRAQKPLPWQNPKLPADKRIDNIVSLLSIDEKIQFLAGFNIPRLNIKAPGSAEGIHQAVIRSFQAGGLSASTTSFCQVYGMGSTWDPELIRKAGAVLGYEARYVTQNEKYKRAALMLWGPTSDLARDPRWGRNDESYSEDPFLAGTMATALTKGIQGDDPNYWQAASLLKHVFANSNETTRGRSSSDFSNRLMREYYSVPFRMAFTEGGAKSYMASYNAWNGIPMTINPVLKEVVAKEWGASWVVSSDAGAIGLAVTGHKYFKTKEEVVAAAIKVGMNQFLELGGDISGDIKKALDDKLLTEDDINSVIRGKFKTMLKLGMLDPENLVPYASIGKNNEPEPWNSEKHRATALQVARESVVLLKNSNNILPLDSKKIKSVVVIGPFADTVLYDFYSGIAPYSVSILDGITGKLEKGASIHYIPDNEYNAAVKAAKEADYAIVVIGNDPMCGTKEIFTAFNQDGSTKPCPECGDGREGRDRQSLDLPGEDLAKEVYEANPNTILVLVSSFPYAIKWSKAHLPAILHITHAAQEQGTAVADVLFGNFNPAGRLVQTWPESLDQLPPMPEYDITKGRTYMYFKGEPLYPFGYGLSYTNFEYSDLKTSSDNITVNGNVVVSATIRNTGRLAGDEVVQLYVAFPDSKVLRPLKALRGFSRITLAPGESKNLNITLKAGDLAWWNDAIPGWEVETGPVKILIGASSQDIRLEKTIHILKE